VAWTVEVWSSTGAYVVRAEPWNAYQDGVGTNWTHTYRFLERLIARNHSWTVRVRRRGDDPFGPVLYSENVKKRRGVPQMLRRVEQGLQRGVRPEELDRT